MTKESVLCHLQLMSYQRLREGSNLQNILNFNNTWPRTVKHSWPTGWENLE